MRLTVTFCIFLTSLFCFGCLIEAKRSGGRSRGSSSSSSSGWFTRKTSKTEAAKPSAPSAPSAPEVPKQSSNLQQNSKPIGWNVDNANKQHVNPVQQSPGNHQSAPAQPPGYHQSAPAYPPSYQQSASAYPPSYHHNTPPSHQQAYPPSYQQNQPNYHQNGYPPAYPGHNYPVHPPSYQQSVGGYPQQHYGGHGGYNYGNYGGYGGYGGHQQTGLMGSLFGGKKHKFNGMGGVGSYAAYGYGVKKSGGFFGKHAFRNVLGGLFVWYLVSGLVSRPYKVYNYYNQPKEQERVEITLPPSVLTLCNENATNICVPGTTGICTQDNRILCVATLATAAACQDDPGKMCVSSNIPCTGANDPLCQNKTTSANTATVSLPCFTNLTLDASAPLPPNITLPASQNQDNKYCVTTMAVPDPDLPVENTQTFDVNAPLNNTTISLNSPYSNVTTLQ